jgi:two-component system phosphate regulon response regulator PhoB
VKSTVLMVDDDEPLVGLVRLSLQRAGHRVLAASGADEAMVLLRQGGVDLLLLDIQLPGLSGLEFLDLLKKDPATLRLPVILLTSRNEEKTRVHALKGGADDYVTKPFSLSELDARVEALLRRARYGGDLRPVLSAGPFRLEVSSREAYAGDSSLELTETEFRLFSLLMESPGKVLPVAALTAALSGAGRETSPDTVYAHIRNLRKKLGRHRRAVRSVHGVGYKLSV